ERYEHRNFDESHSAVDEFTLEGVDLVVARTPYVGRDEVVHSDGKNVLIVRTIEHADMAGIRQRLANTPEKMMRQLFLGRLTEACVPDALRIPGSDNMFDNAALACGVHALQYQQNRTRVAGSAVGVKHLL